MPQYIPLPAMITPGDENIRRVWEAVAVAAARSGLGHAERRRKIFGTVKTGRLKRIAHVLYELGYTGQAKSLKSLIGTLS